MLAYKKNISPLKRIESIEAIWKGIMYESTPVNSFYEYRIVGAFSLRNLQGWQGSCGNILHFFFIHRQNLYLRYWICFLQSHWDVGREDCCRPLRDLKSIARFHYPDLFLLEGFAKGRYSNILHCASPRGCYIRGL